MIDIRYCLYPFARAFEIVGSHTHTHTNTLIPFHIFFSLRYYFVVHDSGLVPAKLPALLRSLLSLSIFVCLKQKKIVYITEFFSPYLFFRERCSFLCVKMFFFIEKKSALNCQYTETSLSHFLKKKGGKNCSFVGSQNFPFFSHAYLLRILPSAALIC